MKMIRNSECISIKTAVKQDDLWQRGGRKQSPATAQQLRQAPGTSKPARAKCRLTDHFHAGRRKVLREKSWGGCECGWRLQPAARVRAGSTGNASPRPPERPLPPVRRHYFTTRPIGRLTAPVLATALAANLDAGHGQNKAPATAGAGKDSVAAHAGTATGRQELTCATGPARPAGPSTPPRRRWPQTCRRPAWPCRACA